MVELNYQIKDSDSVILREFSWLLFLTKQYFSPVIVLQELDTHQNQVHQQLLRVFVKVFPQVTANMKTLVFSKCS